MTLRTRVLPGIACIAAVGLCLLYAAARHQLPDWWRHHGGGIPYVLFWILFWLTVFPRRRFVSAICFLAILVTCGLEFLQMWEGPEWLQVFRRTRFGAAWLGNGFDWFDIPPYFIGGLIGWLIGLSIFRHQRDQAELGDRQVLS